MLRQEQVSGYISLVSLFAKENCSKVSTVSIVSQGKVSRFGGMYNIERLP